MSMTTPALLIADGGNLLAAHVDGVDGGQGWKGRRGEAERFDLRRGSPRLTKTVDINLRNTELGTITECVRDAAEIVADPLEGCRSTEAWRHGEMRPSPREPNPPVTANRVDILIETFLSSVCKQSSSSPRDRENASTSARHEVHEVSTSSIDAKTPSRFPDDDDAVPAVVGQDESGDVRATSVDEGLTRGRKSLSEARRERGDGCSQVVPTNGGDEPTRRRSSGDVFAEEGNDHSRAREVEGKKKLRRAMSHGSDIAKDHLAQEEWRRPLPSMLLSSSPPSLPTSSTSLPTASTVASCSYHPNVRMRSNRCPLCAAKSMRLKKAHLLRGQSINIVSSVEEVQETVASPPAATNNSSIRQGKTRERTFQVIGSNGGDTLQEKQTQQKMRLGKSASTDDLVVPSSPVDSADAGGSTQNIRSSQTVGNRAREISKERHEQEGATSTLRETVDFLPFIPLAPSVGKEKDMDNADLKQSLSNKSKPQSWRKSKALPVGGEDGVEKEALKEQRQDARFKDLASILQELIDAPLPHEEEDEYASSEEWSQDFAQHKVFSHNSHSFDSSFASSSSRPTEGKEEADAEGQGMASETAISGRPNDNADHDENDEPKQQQDQKEEQERAVTPPSGNSYSIVEDLQRTIQLAMESVGNVPPVTASSSSRRASAYARRERSEEDRVSGDKEEDDEYYYGDASVSSTTAVDGFVTAGSYCSSDYASATSVSSLNAVSDVFESRYYGQQPLQSSLEDDDDSSLGESGEGAMAATKPRIFADLNGWVFPPGINREPPSPPSGALYDLPLLAPASSDVSSSSSKLSVDAKSASTGSRSGSGGLTLGGTITDCLTVTSEASESQSSVKNTTQSAFLETSIANNDDDNNQKGSTGHQRIILRNRSTTIVSSDEDADTPNPHASSEAESGGAQDHIIPFRSPFGATRHTPIKHNNKYVIVVEDVIDTDDEDDKTTPYSVENLIPDVVANASKDTASSQGIADKKGEDGNRRLEEVVNTGAPPTQASPVNLLEFSTSGVDADEKENEAPLPESQNVVNSITQSAPLESSTASNNDANDKYCSTDDQNSTLHDRSATINNPGSVQRPASDQQRRLAITSPDEGVDIIPWSVRADVSSISATNFRVSSDDDSNSVQRRVISCRPPFGATRHTSIKQSKEYVIIVEDVVDTNGKDDETTPPYPAENSPSNVVVNASKNTTYLQAAPQGITNLGEEEKDNRRFEELENDSPPTCASLTQPQCVDQLESSPPRVGADKDKNGFISKKMKECVPKITHPALPQQPQPGSSFEPPIYKNTVSNIRQPIFHPIYNLGDVGSKKDMVIFPTVRTSSGKKEGANRAIAAVSHLRHLDAAFVRRSDGNWTYALVADGNSDELRFVVNANGATKSIPKNLWKKCVRRVRALSCRVGDKVNLRDNEQIFDKVKRRRHGRDSSQRRRGSCRTPGRVRGSRRRNRMVSPSPTRRSTGSLDMPETIFELEGNPSH